MMATSNPYRPPHGANDWTTRLPPGAPGADQGMVVQPYTDPGYGMPNPYIGNLNQSPGQTVGGYLLANQLLGPDGQYQPAPQNRLAPWSNFEGDPGTPQMVAPPPLTWEQQLAASRPADYSVDPRMPTHAAAYDPRFKVWRGGTVRLPSGLSTSPDTGEFSQMRWLLPAAREQTD